MRNRDHRILFKNKTKQYIARTEPINNVKHRMDWSNRDQSRKTKQKVLQQSMGPWTGGVEVTLTGRHSPLPRWDRFETEEWTRLGKWPQLLDKQQKIHGDPEISTLSELGVNRVIYRREKAGKRHAHMDVLWMNFQTSSPRVTPGKL